MEKEKKKKSTQLFLLLTGRHCVWLISTNISPRLAEDSGLDLDLHCFNKYSILLFTGNSHLNKENHKEPDFSQFKSRYRKRSV